MKTVSESFNLLGRLGITAVVLLLGQQAMAVGTDPGVDINNTATITYSVGTVGQTPIPAVAPVIEVDRRVDFEVTRLDAALKPANIGDTGATLFLDFFVTNESNGVLDFDLSAFQLITTDGDIYAAGTADSGTTTGGGADDDDMSNVTISVSAGVDPTPGTGDGTAPVFGGPTVIDDLPEDASIRVRLYADALLTLENGDIAGLRLEVRGAAPNLTPLPGDPAEGTVLTETAGANRVDMVDSVFADDVADTLGVETDVSGFNIAGAMLNITKTSTVISDPITGVSPNAKAVPGAIIEYNLEMENTGTVAATAISIADVINLPVVFDADGYSATTNVHFPDTLPAATFCFAEVTTDTNSDGCVIVGTTLTIAGSDLTGTPITVPAGATVNVRFRVELPLTP